MDAVTQLQNYLLSITSFMSMSVQHAWQGAGAVSIEQHKQAVQQEHADAQAQEQQQAAAAKVAALPTIPEAGGSTATAAASSDAPTSAAAAGPPLLIPSLSAPLYSGLHPSVEHAMADRAHQLFKRVLEADTLIQALPPLHAAPHDMASQVEQVQFLEAFNEKAGQELKEAQQEAGQTRPLRNERSANLRRNACAVAVRISHAAACSCDVCSLCQRSGSSALPTCCNKPPHANCAPTPIKPPQTQPSEPRSELVRSLQAHTLSNSNSILSGLDLRIGASTQSKAQQGARCNCKLRQQATHSMSTHDHDQSKGDVLYVVLRLRRARNSTAMFAWLREEEHSSGEPRGALCSNRSSHRSGDVGSWLRDTSGGSHRDG